MTLKHTPGPWLINGKYIEAEMGHCRARLAIIDGGAGVNDHEANANLIAAAPELLGLLTRAYQNLVAQGWEGNLISDIEALLDKATGQNP